MTVAKSKTLKVIFQNLSNKTIQNVKNHGIIIAIFGGKLYEIWSRQKQDFSK